MSMEDIGPFIVLVLIISIILLFLVLDAFLLHKILYAGEERHNDTVNASNYKDFNVVYSTGGYYNGRTITIYPLQIDSYEEYMRIARHEWAHYYYDYESYKGFLKEWNAAISKCGIETEYAKTQITRLVRMQEEFATCFENPTNCCNQKQQVINLITG